ncbi:MscL family protein, partial [Rheinheimera aquimaris]|nr:large conductance mechanosensitive channel protein MscL [Rheinheimera sp.]
DLAVVIQQATETQAEVVIKYGAFIQTIIDFIIIAFAVFVGVKAMNSMKKKEEAKPAPVAVVPEDVKLLTEIRDLLKKD